VCNVCVPILLLPKRYDGYHCTGEYKVPLSPFSTAQQPGEFEVSYAMPNCESQIITIIDVAVERLGMCLDSLGIISQVTSQPKIRLGCVTMDSQK
jgi:hypothetical protein